MAEGILRQKALSSHPSLTVDSAGTGDYHVGEAPDDRAIVTAANYGVDIASLQARQFTADDFERFDHILVMDLNNRREVLKQTDNPDHHAKVRLMMDVLYPGEDMEVPDPWFGGMEGFARVFEMLDSACEQFLQELK